MQNSTRNDEDEIITEVTVSEEIEPETEELGDEIEEPKKNSILAEKVCDILDILVTSVAAVIIVFTFFIRVANVNGTSMTNTLQHGDGLIITNLFYTPKTGDIIVCQTDFFGKQEPIVKRVIATAGQTVRLDTTNWAVYVDGEKLNEDDYVNFRKGYEMNGWDYGEEYVVPDGYVFCMGDNRNGSWDCRDARVGPVDERCITGKVVFRFSPFNNMRAF